MSTLMQASRPLARARSQSNTMRPFSIAIPARLANEWMHMPKPRGFLAEYVLSSFLLTLFSFLLVDVGSDVIDTDEICLSMEWNVELWSEPEID